jgi:hypothetical protein
MFHNLQSTVHSEEDRLPSKYIQHPLLRVVDSSTDICLTCLCFQCPQGESESDYVFVTEHPQELVVKFPVTGQHKICR